jgi:hypothetical protein
MSGIPSSQDRRQHYRINCAVRRPSAAHLFVNDARIPAVTPLNFSAGGLLCAVELGDLALAPGQKVDCVQLVFPQKPPLAFSGTVIRMEPQDQAQKYLCAIQFESMLSSDTVPSTDYDANRLMRQIKAGEVSDALIQRLKFLPNYMQMSDPQKAANVREQVYASFSTVLGSLDPGERWWFGEVLDALKSMEPQYPFGLLEEYLRLCKKAYSSAYRRLMEERYGGLQRVDYQPRHDC